MARVGIRPEQVVGADPEGGRTPGIANLPQPRRDVGTPVEHDHAGLQHGIPHRQRGQDGEMVPAVPQEMAHPAHHRFRARNTTSPSVKRSTSPARRPGAARGRVVLPEPSLGQLFDVNHLQAVVPRAQAIRNFAGAVVGPIVDEDHLVVRVVQVEQRRERLLQPRTPRSGPLPTTDSRGKGGIAVAGHPDLFKEEDMPVAVQGDQCHGDPDDQRDGGRL